MTEDEKKEFEEFLEWKKIKSSQTDNETTNKEHYIENNNAPSIEPKKSGALQNIGYGCLSILAFFIIVWCCAGSTTKQEENNKVDETEASVISESFIKSFIKFPDDVVFIKETKRVINEGNYTFKITGRVKANNSFGQAVPYTYNIRIKYNGGDWAEFRGGHPVNWTLVGGNLYNEATQDFQEF
jgi:hypothetical protein